MISEIEIENFKGISNFKIDDLKQFNILIGKNDSSKTTILESLFAFHASLIKPEINFPIVIRNRFGQQHARELWHNYSTSVNPIIKIKVHGLDCHLTFHSDFDFNFVDVKMKIIGKGEISYKLTSQFNKVTDQKNQNLFTSLEGHIQEFFGSLLFFDEMYRLKIREWENYILARGLKGIDVYDDSAKTLTPVDYTGGQKRLMAGEGTSAKFLDGFGEGHKSGLALLTIANSLKNTVLLIEEIETHQHPEAIRELITNLIKICITNKNQIFVTTHSPEVLQLFATTDKTKLIHLSKPKNDKIVVSEIAPNNITMIRDLGWNLGKILSYEKFVLVEGELDKVVLEHSFYKLKKYWPEEVGITIIVTYGSGKQKQILKSISIPEKSVFIQRDFDTNTKEDLEKSVIDGFCELTKEGYTRKDEGDIITLSKDTISKRLDKSKIIPTGLPARYNEITSHATDDYLLYLLEKDTTILNKINSVNTTLPKLQANTSKEILSSTCGNYNSEKAIDIINNSEGSNFPNELKNIINLIETS